MRENKKEDEETLPHRAYFEGERMGLGFYFSSFFSLWKMDGRRITIESKQETEILKDVNEDWMKDERCNRYI